MPSSPRQTALWNLFLGTVLGLSIYTLFWKQYLGLNMTLAMFIYIAIVQVIKYVVAPARPDGSRKRIYFTHWDFWFVLYGIIALTFAINDSQSIKVISTVLFILTLPVLTYLAIYPYTLGRFSFVNSFLIFLQQIFGGLSGAINLVKSIFTKTVDGKNEFKFGSLKFYIGLLIALPFMCGFTYILMQADEVFATFVRNIITNIGDFVKAILRLENIKDIFIVLWFVITATIGLSSYMSSKINFNLKDIPLKTPTDDRGYEMYITNIVLAGINLIFITFVIFQLRLIFNAESYLADTGITYANFARRGFFELQFVMFGVVLIMYLVQALRKVANNVSTKFTSINLLIMAFCSVIMGWATLFRLEMYEDAYGLTLKRLFSSSFTAFEIIMIVFLIVAIFRRQILKYFSGVSFMTFVIIICILGILSPERIVAKRNIDRQSLERKEIDYSYLINQSSDAYGEIVDNAVIGSDVKCMLARKYLKLKSYNPSWHEYSISGHRANQNLEKIIINEENAKQMITDCEEKITIQIESDLRMYTTAINNGEFEKAYEEYWDKENSVYVDGIDTNNWRLELKSLDDYHYYKDVDSYDQHGYIEIDSMRSGYARLTATYEDPEKLIVCNEGLSYKNKNGETKITSAEIMHLGVYSYQVLGEERPSYVEQDIERAREDLNNPSTLYNCQVESK